MRKPSQKNIVLTTGVLVMLILLFPFQVVRIRNDENVIVETSRGMRSIFSTRFSEVDYSRTTLAILAVLLGAGLVIYAGRPSGKPDGPAV